MLKYGEIIEKLNIDEKLNVLTNGSFLSQACKENPQLPSLDIGTAADFNEDSDETVCPSLAALASSWDTTATATNTTILFRPTKSLCAEATPTLRFTTSRGFLPQAIYQALAAAL